MRSKTKDDWKEEREQRGKDPKDMTLVEIRNFFAKKIEECSFYLPDANYAWVIKWLQMPISEFEDRWKKTKQECLNSLQAKEEFYCMTGAMKKQGKGYGPAVVMPEGYKGPLGVNVIDWRFYELGLIEYARKKDDERLLEAALDMAPEPPKTTDLAKKMTLPKTPEGEDPWYGRMS